MVHEARAVEQHVERAFARGERRDVLRVRHVEPTRGQPAARALGVGPEPHERGFVDVGRQHVGALAREPQRGRAADALPGRRHQRAFALQSHEHLPKKPATRRPIGTKD